MTMTGTDSLMSEAMVPVLAELNRLSRELSDLSPEALVTVLGATEQLRARLWAQLLQRPGPEDSAVVPDGLLTAAEAARHLRLPLSSVYELARQGRLPAIRIGKYVRFRQSDLETWMVQRRQEPLDRRPRRLHTGLGALRATPQRG